MAYILGDSRIRAALFPDTIEEYVEVDNPVRVIDGFVDLLDMRKLGFQRAEPNNIGRPSYDPRDLLKLYLYGYLNRIRSSRRLEIEAGRNIELFWLLRKLKPDFKTIADFRKDNSEALKGVFKCFVLICREWDLYGKELAAIDGSKFRASNSKRNNFNIKKIERQLNYINERINSYLEELDANDESEANTCTSLNPEEILQRLKELEKRKTKYTDMLEQLRKTGDTEISTVDPDARLMGVNNNGVEVSYNVQTAVDQKHKLVIDSEVVNTPADQGQLAPMAKLVKEALEVEELRVLADKGYYTTNDLVECEKNRIETYVAKPRFTGNITNPDFQANNFQYDPEQNTYLCPAGQILYPYRITESKGVKHQRFRNYRACKGCSFRPQCTKSKTGRTISRNLAQPLLDKVDRRTKENRALYRQRQMIVEHPFGTIKRIWGYSYFLTRGLNSVSTENKLHLLAYNLRRVINILGVKEILRRLALV